MKLGDKIRKQVYENDRIRNEKLNCQLPFDLDEVCEEFLYAKVDVILNQIVTSSTRDGKIVYENGKRILRTTMNYENMYYMAVSEKFKRYVDRLRLPRNKTFLTSDGCYELKYIKYHDFYMDDEWSICRTKNNQNDVMNGEVRKHKVGLFGLNYRYEMKIDKCYDLKRFSKWFEQRARQEGMKATFYPYVRDSISRGRNSIPIYKTLPAFDEWFETDKEYGYLNVGVTIQVDVEL